MGKDMTASWGTLVRPGGLPVTKYGERLISCLLTSVDAVVGSIFGSPIVEM